MSEWDARYSRGDFLYGEAPNDFVAETARRLKPESRVLLLGEGEGRNGLFLASLGHDVTGVDASAVGVEKARAWAERRSLRASFVHADLDAFEFGVDQWDAVVSVWCHLPPELRARVHARSVAALRPLGWFILEAYTPAQLGYGTGGPQVAELLYTLDDLARDLRGLRLVHAVETVREIHEGAVHNGPSAVVQVAAQKPDRGDSSGPAGPATHP